jgi:hypothetical protein
VEREREREVGSAHAQLGMAILPASTDMGKDCHPRARIRAKIVTRGHITGKKPCPWALPVTRIQPKAHKNMSNVNCWPNKTKKQP